MKKVCEILFGSLMCVTCWVPYYGLSYIESMVRKKGGGDNINICDSRIICFVHILEFIWVVFYKLCQQIILALI